MSVSRVKPGLCLVTHVPCAACGHGAAWPQEGVYLVPLCISCIFS